MSANPLPFIPADKTRLAGTAAMAVIVIAAIHLMPNSYWLRVFTLAGLYVMLAMGLNVVAGFAGLLDLAYVAFFGIGGYVFALLSSDHLGIHLPFPVTLPLAGLASMVCGICIGASSARLKGDYLAIVTLAFAQIFKLLLLNLDRPVNLTGGVNGIYSFDPITVFGLRILKPVPYAYLIWGFAFLTVAASFRIKESRLGRGWRAIREDELAAAATGVNTTLMKLAAFAGGALVAGLTGAVFASFQDSVFPNNFDFPQLVMVYCMVILGGMGNITGVFLGAILLTVLPEFLREYGSFRMMSYGVILVLLMALRPEGLLSGLPFLRKTARRPDKDQTGRLRTSTDLYYSQQDSTHKKNLLGKTGEPLLKIKGVCKNFGGLTAVADIDLTLHKGEILSIIGPNGAGKSTLFNVISGIYAPDKGQILLKGKNITGDKPHRITRAGLARTFQSLRLFDNMTVLDNAKVGRFGRTKAGPLSILLGLPRHKKEERETDETVKKTLARFGKRLTGYRFHQKVSSLSYANRRRVEIARALATGADILLLDEPAAGMNPQETVEITNFIKELRDIHGFTILLIEHKLQVVRTISDHVLVLDSGRTIASGSYHEVAENPQVIEAYLGKRRSAHDGTRG